MDQNIDTLVTKLKQSRARLDAAIQKIAPQEEIYPSWQLKQLLDHITGWDELVMTTLHNYRNGETPKKLVKQGIDQYNAESIHARKAISLEQSRQAYADTRQKVLQTLGELPPEMLSQQYQALWGGKCTVASVVKIFASHELEHAKKIEEILQKPSEIP